jgi:hypothetical protein
MAGAAEAIRPLAYHLHPYEPLAKAGVLDRVFTALQEDEIIRIKVEALALDSTIVKVHPDGTGAEKKRPAVDRTLPRGVDHQNSSGCRGCATRRDIRPVARTGPRRTCRTGAAPLATGAGTADRPDHGSGVRRRPDAAVGSQPRFHARRPAAE